MSNILSALVEANIISIGFAKSFDKSKSAIKQINRELDYLYSGNLQKNENRIVVLESRKEKLNHAF